MEEAVEKFAVFGGVSWGDIDTSRPNIELIEELILPDFRYIRNDVTELTTGLPLHHAILTGLALGDSRIQTAFKRANVSKELGEQAILELAESKVIRSYKSTAIFNSPFLRFWFAFVSPLFKGIRDGEYKEIQERFTNREQEFIQYTFLQLAYERIKLNFKESRLKEIRPHFEKGLVFDIFATTAEKKIILGSCKYTNAKMKKSELTKLQESAQEAGINADIFVLVSKSGFSNELKSMKSESIRLLSLKNFKKLVE